MVFSNMSLTEDACRINHSEWSDPTNPITQYNHRQQQQHQQQPSTTTKITLDINYSKQRFY